MLPVATDAKTLQSFRIRPAMAKAGMACIAVLLNQNSNRVGGPDSGPCTGSIAGHRRCLRRSDLSAMQKTAPVPSVTKPSRPKARRSRSRNDVSGRARVTSRSVRRPGSTSRPRVGSTRKRRRVCEGETMVGSACGSPGRPSSCLGLRRRPRRVIGAPLCTRMSEAGSPPPSPYTESVDLGVCNALHAAGRPSVLLRACERAPWLLYDGADALSRGGLALHGRPAACGRPRARSCLACQSPGSGAIPAAEAHQRRVKGVKYRLDLFAVQLAVAA